ncbi:hypothetical protein [Chromobacterium sp. ASV23]|uniref:hypothetical protein n=1 Tax=Chromobacterium sp. ASV23 TaxID=2795110 RepID=UPI0018EBA973|nr:hypothetical protein [Chromobacterium sp. ASV23]
MEYKGFDVNIIAYRDGNLGSESWSAKCEIIGRDAEGRKNCFTFELDGGFQGNVIAWAAAQKAAEEFIDSYLQRINTSKMPE